MVGRYHAAGWMEQVASSRRFGPLPKPGLFGRNGVIAQLGERYNGIVEVGGSIPPGSTIQSKTLRRYRFSVFFLGLYQGVAWGTGQ